MLSQDRTQQKKDRTNRKGESNEGHHHFRTPDGDLFPLFDVLMHETVPATLTDLMFTHQGTV